MHPCRDIVLKIAPLLFLEGKANFEYDKVTSGYTEHGRSNSFFLLCLLGTGFLKSLFLGEDWRSPHTPAGLCLQIGMISRALLATAPESDRLFFTIAQQVDLLSGEVNQEGLAA